MDAFTVMSRLAALIDAHRWDERPGLLHDDFDGLVAEMTEVWTDVEAKAPAGTRPA